MRIFILLLLFLPFLSAAQMRVGRMIIGVTRMDSLRAIVGEPLETSSGPISTAKFNSGTPIEMTRPNGGSTGQKSVIGFTSEYRLVHLGLWQFGDLKFTGIELIFHNDTLISF